MISNRLHMVLRFCLLFSLLSVPAFFGGRAEAQVEPDFQLVTLRELDTEYGLPYDRYVWIVGTNRVGFIPPLRWRVTGSPERKRLTFQQENMKASITITMLPMSVIPPPPAPKEGDKNATPPPPGAPPTAEQWKLLMQDTFPGAKIENEWESIANGMPAKTFDIVHFPDGVRQSIRAVYIYKTGVPVELIYRTSGKFTEHVGEFMGIVGTFEFSPPKPAVVR